MTGQKVAANLISNFLTPLDHLRNCLLVHPLPRLPDRVDDGKIRLQRIERRDRILSQKPNVSNNQQCFAYIPRRLGGDVCGTNLVSTSHCDRTRGETPNRIVFPIYMRLPKPLHGRWRLIIRIVPVVGQLRGVLESRSFRMTPSVASSYRPSHVSDKGYYSPTSLTNACLRDPLGNHPLSYLFIHML